MHLPAFVRSRPRWQWLLGVLVLGGVAWDTLLPARARAANLTVTAKRGPLDINVLVGGSLEALESQELLCEVSGEQVKILKIVDEGYQVTEEDVKAHKVLVELDSSKLKQNYVNQDITFQSTKSGLIEAQQGYEIQVNQNRTDVKAAEQKVRFGRMDLERYLGARITAEIIEKLGLREDLLDAAAAGEALGGSSGNSLSSSASNSSSVASGNSSDTSPSSTSSPASISASSPASTPAVTPNVTIGATRIDFAQYAREGLLEDGTGKQELRKREDELLLAKTTLGQAETKLAWTKRLSEQGFITKSELETDQNSADQTRLRVDAAITAVDLFVKYEFPKTAEETLGKFEEALAALIRARKEAVSRLAQAEAKRKGAQARYEIEKQKQDELEQQIKNCQLYAKTPGLVVYGGGSDRNFWGSQERIAVGAQVYERQPIITIPDQTKMGVNVGVHESHIMKVKKGQHVKVTADAFPDDPLDGEVIKVGVLPDSQNRWMNPDLKLYSTRIAIHGTREWMKPGMSAKIEIHVKRLDDVVYVPLQTVCMRDGKQVVFRPDRESEPLAVEVGEFNDEFVEIKSGLANGDVILLRTPDREKSNGDEKKPDEPKPLAPEKAPGELAKG